MVWLSFLPRLTLLLFAMRLLALSMAFRTSNLPASRGMDFTHSMTHSMAHSMTHSMTHSGFTAEVVGASGRMGTFWLDRHRDHANRTGEGEGFGANYKGCAIGCPRGGTPGRLTPDGCPIYVATPSDAYLPIFEATPPSRRGDLVFAGNAGLPIDDRFQDCTILVPHFSVLYQNQWKGDESKPSEKDTEDAREAKNPQKADNRSSSRRIQVNTDPLVSPPTYVYGKHAKMVANILTANGIATETVPSFREIKAYSGRKLVWASCFWLLCHSCNGNDDCDCDSKLQAGGQPLTVGQVHELRQDDLVKLVDEILPSLRDWLLVPEDQGGNKPGTKSTETDPSLERIIDRTTVLDYLRAYSESISGAVPSVDLAKQEFRDRNAVWLMNPENEGLSNHKQPFHIQLLEELGVDVGSATL